MKKEYIIGGVILLAIIGFIAFIAFKVFLITKREACIRESVEEYHQRWNKKCSSMNEEDDCLMPPTVAKAYRDNLNSMKDDCINLYK